MFRVGLAMAMAGVRTRISIIVALPLICSVAATYTALQIEVGAAGQMCAILEDSSLKCWGTNGRGYLILGDSQDRGTSANQMGDNLPFVSLGTGRTAKSLGLGEYGSCVILDDDSVKCWGDEKNGNLGQPDYASWGDGDINVGDHPDEVGDNMPAVNVGSGHTVKQVVSGRHNVCVLLDDGNSKFFSAGFASFVSICSRNGATVDHSLAGVL